MGTVLAATGLVVGVSMTLAALLLVAERVLVNYGPCTLDVNDGARTFEVQGGQSLLATLLGQNIFIPSACGGKGTCAYCKVKVLEGAGPVSPTEEPLLDPGDLENQIRISCQCKVRTDMRIRIPEHLLAVREYGGTVERMQDLTHDIKLVRIALAEGETLDFVPGQYIQLMAPAYGDNPEPVYRAYSIASPPSDPSHLDLIIRLAPGGICTTWVFTVLAEGDEVTFNGPYGEFRLSDSGAPMAWIAGGSGMAPFWSIVRHMDETGLARPTQYFFGAVAKRDLFLLDELRALQEKHDWFRFIPALSGPAPEDPWEGEAGLITEVVDRHVDAGTDAEGYLCGSPGMIDAAIKVLEAKGLGEDRIFYDKFA